MDTKTCIEYLRILYLCVILNSMEQPTIFITGVTSGLGKVAALELANSGAKLIAACRNMTKGEQLLRDYAKEFPNGKGRITLIECNLSSFASIRKVCEEIKSGYDILDQVILNAGVWHFEYTESEDGIEDIFQVNLLAPHFIIDELLPLVENSEDGRIIITSSGLHQKSINFTDIEFKKEFSGIKAYRQSKLAVILMTRWMHKKIGDRVGVYCQHPGVVKTDLGRHAKWFPRAIFKLMGTSAKKGARTLLYLARTPQSELTSGEYYTKSKLTKTTAESYDMEAAERLMKVSLDYRNGNV
jgi:NAD(P)-dependent dehydrogenase (short-subunit alcohol dehydrogenase family)